jgi:PAS domain-containing protein
MTNGLTGGRPHVRAEARGLHKGRGPRRNGASGRDFRLVNLPEMLYTLDTGMQGDNRMAWATGKTAGSGEAAQSEEHRYRAIFQHSAVSLWEEDITELRAAIQALQADGVPSLSEYLDAHPEFLRQATKLIRVIDVNDATLRLYEVPRKEDLLGSLDITLDLDDPLMLTSIRDEILKIAEGKNLYTHESTAVTPGGRKLNIIVEAHIPGPDDSYPHMLVSVIDVTEQRRAQEALRESERELHRSQQMLRSVLDNIPQRVF